MVKIKNRVLLKPTIKELDNVEVYRLSDDDIKTIWDLKIPLFGIRQWSAKDADSIIVVDLKLAQNIARALDALIKREMLHK